MMTTDRAEQPDAPRGSRALPIAVLLTILYLLTLILVIGWQRTTWADVQRLELNELGDALAGAFAPLAFLWLAAAVFIQRRELELTRIEFADNRRVTQLQADEAKRQAEFIGAQVLIAQEQRKSDSEDRGDALYKQRFENLLSALAPLTAELAYRYGPTPSTHGDRVVSLQSYPASIVGVGVFVSGAVQTRRQDDLQGRIAPSALFRAFSASVIELEATLTLASSISLDHAQAAGIDVLAGHVREYLALDTDEGPLTQNPHPPS